MQRVVPDCPAWHGGCDGCNLLHLTELEERMYKGLLVHEVLQRLGGVTWPVAEMGWLGAPESALVGDDWEMSQARAPAAHRRRTRLRVSVEDGRVRTRFGGMLPGTVVDVLACGAVTWRLQTVLSVLHDSEDAPLVGALQRVDPSSDSPFVLEMCEGEGDEVFMMAEELDAGRLSRVAAALSRLLDGQNIDVRVADADHAAWSATHSSRGGALMTWLRRVLGEIRPRPARALDATCGAGSMTAVLASICEQVVAVDVNYAAVLATREKAASEGWADRLDARGGRIETVLPRIVADGERFDVVVFNPMRRTIGRRSMDAAAATGASTVLYFGPAPRAASEDIAYLLEAGFRMHEVCLVDLHPGTSRVMAAMVMKR
jgi:tRNA/tmRNA/rRNA uracil-C5-methylase (TrmA/RlmC/RlmD family)